MLEIEMGSSTKITSTEQIFVLCRVTKHVDKTRVATSQSLFDSKLCECKPVAVSDRYRD